MIFFAFLRAYVRFSRASALSCVPKDNEMSEKKMIQKKEGLSHDNPIFINLKSNTMKNTMQKYCFYSKYANICAKNMFYSIKYANFVI